MKKLNFNHLKNVKTPESWIEKAINIPQQNKKPIPFYFRPYVIASAACFVFCCVVSFIIFVNFNNTAPVPVTPAQKTSVSENSNQSSFPDNNAELFTFIQATSSDNGSTSAENGSVGVNGNSVLTNPDFPKNSGNPSYPINETHSNSLNDTKNPTTKAVSPNSTDPENNTPSTTRPNKVTEPPEPTVIPTEPFTDYPAVNPTIENPTVAWNPSVAEDPSVPGYQDNKDKFCGNIYFIAKKNGILSKNSNIFCHIESLEGISYTVRYSNSELVYDITDCNGSYYGVYNPSDRSIYLYKGQYDITFYDSFGNSVKRRFYLGDDNIYFYE